MSMLTNHLFWMSAVLFICSAVNINVFKEYKQSIRVLPYIIGIAGVFGMIGVLVRLIDLSARFNWWWFVAIAGTALLTIGVLSFLTRNKISVVFGTINVFFIPFIWWYGSRFNTTLTTDWFYKLLDGMKGFFA